MLDLKDDFLLAKGSERLCYAHPINNNQVIKIMYNQKSMNNQNQMEYKYYNLLKKRKVSFDHITMCYGWIETNLGIGLIFDRVNNYDNSDIFNLRYMLQNKLISNELETYLLEELKEYLYKNKILFTDPTTLNIMCKKISKIKYKFIIIDGLGARKRGIKEILYKVSPFYSYYKIKKQWAVLINNIKKVKLKIELNQKL